MDKNLVDFIFCAAIVTVFSLGYFAGTKFEMNPLTVFISGIIVVTFNYLVR